MTKNSSKEPLPEFELGLLNFETNKQDINLRLLPNLDLPNHLQVVFLVLTACKWRFAFTEYIPKFKTYIHTISPIFRSPGTLFKYSRSIPDCCSLRSWPSIFIVFHTTPTRNITYSYYKVLTYL